MVDGLVPAPASAVMYSATISGVAGIGVSWWSVHHQTSPELPLHIVAISMANLGSDTVPHKGWSVLILLC